MPRHLYLVRHGVPENSGALLGQSDAVLTAPGRQQARRVAEELRDRGIERVLSSGLQRAVETAESIAERLGLEVEIDLRLNEISYGVWDGLHWEEIERVDPDTVSRKRRDWWGVTPEGAEAYSGFYQRVRDCWRDTLLPERAVTVVVAHLGVNAVLADLALNPGSVHNECGSPDWQRIVSFEQECGSFMKVTLPGS